MAVLPIIIAPDPRLKLRCKPVEAVDDDTRRLMDDMLETMYLAPGIGLAAPQVGVAKRVVVIDVSRKEEPRDPIRMANPEIVAVSQEMASYEEGCLSLPEHYADVERPAAVTVRFLDETGKRREETFDGLAATCIQHEIDHLDGLLFVDHISALKRNMILRKLTKQKRVDEKDRQKAKAVA
ncbi:MAG: peptide deformylase [Alphaproteobacteria bacterium]